jgi:hypothetical protein
MAAEPVASPPLPSGANCANAGDKGTAMPRIAREIAPANRWPWPRTRSTADGVGAEWPPLLRLPRPVVISEAATHAPRDSFQMDLYDVFIGLGSELRKRKK